MHIPLPFGQHEEQQAMMPWLGRRRWRWALDVFWFGVLLNREIAYGDDAPWTSTAYGWGVGLCSWSWSTDHVWWDGQHCRWDFGFVYFTREGRKCPTCEHFDGY